MWLNDWAISGVVYSYDLVKLGSTIEFSLNDFYWIHWIQCEKNEQSLVLNQRFGQSEAVQHMKCTIFHKGFHEGISNKTVGRCFQSYVSVHGRSMWPLSIMHWTRGTQPDSSPIHRSPSPGPNPLDMGPNSACPLDMFKLVKLGPHYTGIPVMTSGG